MIPRLFGVEQAIAEEKGEAAGALEIRAFAAGFVERKQRFEHVHVRVLAARRRWGKPRRRALPRSRGLPAHA